MTQKSLLLISRQAPWTGATARALLELGLTGGAFDLPITLVFLEDGVFQLLSGQQATAVQQKDLTANLQALPFFGIDEIYASARALEERGIHPNQLVPLAKTLADSELSNLFQQHDYAVSL